MKNEAIFKIDCLNFVIGGIRYARPGSKVVLLLHGVMNNCSIWKFIGKFLYDQGFDVWMPNFRGHGSDHCKSYVKNPKKGDYSFSNLVMEDMRIILDYIFKQTSAEITIIGHSNGANVAQSAIAGLIKTPTGDYIFSETERARICDRVKKVINIGSTFNWTVGSEKAKALVKLGNSISRFISFTIPNLADVTGTFDEHNAISPDTLSIRESLYFSILQSLLSPNIVNFWNGNDEIEIFRALSKGLAPFPADLGVDFLKFINDGKCMIGNIDLGSEVYYPLKTLYIAGEYDSLAQPKAVESEAQRAADYKQGEVDYYFAANTGHIDLIVGTRALQTVGLPILDFLGKAAA